jgi:hypothetical protein
MMRLKSLAVFISGMALAATAVLAHAAPAIAAAVCPSCYGLKRISLGVYADREGSDLSALILAARQQVSQVWTPMRAADPIVLICSTTACDHHLGGRGARGMAYGDFVIHLSPKGANQTIAAHEMAHSELHHRIGMIGLWQDQVPA